MHRAYLVALVGCLVTACVAGAPPSAPVASPSAPPASSPSPTPFIEPRSAPPTNPGHAGSAIISLLECDGAPSSVGGLAEDFGPTGGAETADAAFGQWLDRHPFALPRKGYVLGWADEARALYVFPVWGKVKVAVLVSTRLGAVVGRRFTVDEVRACEPGELGLGVVDGQREWRQASSGAVLLEIPGNAHCAWQSIRFLDLVRDGEPRQYVRDPLSLLPAGSLVTTLGRAVSLPREATFTGYRSGELELWLTPDDAAAYVVSPTGVERWPRALEPLGCV